MKLVRLFGFVLVCCGGGATSNTANVAPLPSATSTIAPTQVARRGPSDALVRAWPLDHADLVAYVDVAGLASTQSIAALAIATAPIIGPPIFTPDETTCARAVLLATKEIAVGMMNKDELLVARMSGDLGALHSCFASFTPATIAGATQAYRSGNDAIAITADGVFAYGEASIVERAVRGNNEGAALRSFTLRPHEYGVADYASDGDKAHVAFVVTDQRMAMNASIDFHDDESPKSLVKTVDGLPKEASTFLDKLVKPDERAVIEHLFHQVHATAHDRHADLSFELVEPAAEQARELAVGVNGVARAVRKTIDAFKKLEVYENLDAIGRAIAADFDAQPSGFARKKLKSLPPVPKDIPRGVKVQTKPDDWNAWAPIKFSITTTQYYQYEVRAAKDGESAEVIAHGDLDGDGQLSTFTLAVNLDRKAKKVVVAPTPVTTDPDE